MTTKPKQFNHAFDVTPAMLIAACRARLTSIEAENNGAEMLEACNRYDTFEVGK